MLPTINLQPTAPASDRDAHKQSSQTGGFLGKLAEKFDYSKNKRRYTEKDAQVWRDFKEAIQTKNLKKVKELLKQPLERRVRYNRNFFYEGREINLLDLANKFANDADGKQIREEVRKTVKKDRSRTEQDFKDYSKNDLLYWRSVAWDWFYIKRSIEDRDLQMVLDRLRDHNWKAKEYKMKFFADGDATTILEFAEKNATDESGREIYNAVLKMYASAKSKHSLPSPDEQAATLVEAASLGQLDRVIQLVDEGAEVDKFETIKYQTKYGSTNRFSGSALMAASLNARLDVAEALVYAGANVGLTSSEGYQALFYACAANPRFARDDVAPIVQLLVDNGAVVKPADEPTPQNEKVPDPKEVEMVNELKKLGYYVAPPAPPKPPKKPLLSTPLLKACEFVHLEAARVLIKNGADVNARDARRMTPLIHVSDNGRSAFGAVANKQVVELAKLLIDAGAELNATEQDGATALGYATGFTRQAEHVPNQALVDLLLQNGAVGRYSRRGDKRPEFGRDYSW